MQRDTLDPWNLRALLHAVIGSFNSSSSRSSLSEVDSSNDLLVPASVCTPISAVYIKPNVWVDLFLD